MRYAHSLPRICNVRTLYVINLGLSRAPAFDHHIAAALASLGIPVFACTPDRFPDLMAAGIKRRDISS